MSSPRIVLHGEYWRVVAMERPDEHGVLRVDYVIEMTEPREVDALGVQRWHMLTGKSAMSDWMAMTRRLLDVLLKQAGEAPDVDEQPF